MIYLLIRKRKLAKSLYFILKGYLCAHNFYT